MSLASVHPAGMRTLGHVGVRSLSVASSLDALAARYAVSEAEAARIHAAHCDTVLTIEELRSQTNSCFTCGVSWAEQHVSLDCSECGGYALERPCPTCDGACSLLWKRDLTLSHACGKARWHGACARAPASDVKVAPPLAELCRRMSEAAQVAPSS